MKKYIKLILLIADLLAFGLGLYASHQGDIATTIFWSIQSLIIYFKLNDKD